MSEAPMVGYSKLTINIGSVPDASLDPLLHRRPVSDPALVPVGVIVTVIIIILIMILLVKIIKRTNINTENFLNNDSCT